MDQELLTNVTESMTMGPVSSTYSMKFKMLRAVSAARRLFRGQFFVTFSQAAIAVLNLVVLGYVLEWIVNSLLHLPLLVTVIAVLLVMVPSFYIFWIMLRYFGGIKTHLYHR